MTPPTRSGSGSGSASRPIPPSAPAPAPAPRPSSPPTRAASDSSTAAAAPAVQLKFGEHTSRPGSAPPLPLPGTALLAFPAPAASNNNGSSSRRPPSGRGSARSPQLKPESLDMDSGFQTVAKKGKGGRNAKKENPKRSAASPTSPSADTDARSASSLNGGDTASESSSLPPSDPMSIKPLRRKLSARKIPDTTSVAFPQSIEHALAARTEQLSDLTFGAIPSSRPKPSSSTSPTSASSQQSVPPPHAPSPGAAARNPSPALTPAPLTAHPAPPATHQLPPKPAVGPNPPSHISPPTHRAASPAAAKHTQQQHTSGPVVGVSLPPQANVGHQPHMQHGGVPNPHYASATPSPVTPHAPQMHQGQMPPHYQQQQQQQQYGGQQQQHQQSYGQSGYGGNRGGQGGSYQHGGYKNQRSGPNNRHSGPPQQHQYGPPQQQQQQQQQQHYHNQQHQQHQQHQQNAPYQQHQQHQPQAGGMHHVQQPPTQQQQQQQPSNQSTPAPTPTSATPAAGVVAPMYAGMPMNATGARPGVNVPPQGMMMAAAMPAMPQGMPMYVAPDGQMLMPYYYAMPQMPQPQPQMQSYASSPSQLLAQMKAQQQQQQPGMYPPPPAAAATAAATAGTPAPAPYGQQQPSTNRPPPSASTNPPTTTAAATTVSGMVLPQGVNVPQPQQLPVIQVQPMPMSTAAGSAPPVMIAPPPVSQVHMPAVPPPMAGHSTSPPLLAHTQLGVPPAHSPITASSPTPPLGGGAARPAIRIASKDDPTKTIQLNELATKVGRTSSHRGSTAGLPDDGGDTASVATVSSVGGGGATATTPDGAADGGETSQMGEGQLIAKRQVEENMRRGTKALEIKRPEHPRGGTPSPRPGSSPVVGRAAVKVPPAAAVAEKGKEEGGKARSRSRSKSPAKPATVVDIEKQGGEVVAFVEEAAAKNGVKEHEQEVKRGRSKSPAPKPAAAAPIAKPKSPSPARPAAAAAVPAQQVPTTKVEQAPAAAFAPAAKPRTPSPAKARTPSPAKEAKKEAERVPSPSPVAPKEVKKERSPSPPKKQARSPSPPPPRSKSPSPVRSGPSSPKNVPTAAPETPEPAAQKPERTSSPARSTASDLEEGEIRASPTSGQYPEVLQLVDADENGVFRYSRSRLTELCMPDLPLPNGINLAVFADLRGARGGGAGAGGMPRGGGAGGSSRGGMRIGMPERAMSTPTPYQGSAPGSGMSTPTRERRPMPMPPGAAAAAAMAASSSGRSMSGRGESRRDGSRRGTDRDAASGDREKRGSKRGTKRMGTTEEAGGSASSSSMSLPGQPQQPQLAVTGAALQPSERAHGARGVEVLPEDLKPLEKSSTAWVPESVLQKVAPGALPTPASADANLSEGEAEVQREAEYCTQIEKQMRGVLNKLTPENMERLQPRFAESLKYPSALKLIGRLIVRKSFDEPKYASLYASLTLYMYHHIKPLEGMPDDPDGHKAVRSAVRRIIIHECQDQFSRRPRWAHLAKGSISEEQFEEVVKIKSKVLGNMRFVAELFNYAVISKKVMQAILFELTKETTEPAEEDLECLIVLITTTGQHLKDQIGKKEIDELFKTRVMPIAENADLIPRIKFAVMDLVHLWKSNFSKVKVPIPSAAQASAAASSVSRQDSREFGRRGGDSRGGDTRGYGGQSAGSSSGRYSDRGGERSERFDRSNNNSTEFRPAGGRSDRGPRDARGGYDRSSTGGYERGGDRSDRYSGGQDRSERSGGGSSGTWSSQQGGPRRGGPGAERERGGDRSSRYGSNDPDARASPEGGFSSRGGPGPRSGTPSTRGGSSSRAPATGPGSRASFGGFGALLGDDGNDESEDEPAAPPVRKILARPSATQSASSSSPKRTKSPEPSVAVPAAPVLEVTTDEQAVARIEKAMKEFLTNFDYQELADQFIKYAKDVVPAALGRSIEIITEEKEKQVRIYGQGLATAVKEGILPAELVISGIMSSMIMEEYEDMKVDIPQLDTLTKALCEELTKAMDASVVAPLLAKTTK